MFINLEGFADGVNLFTDNYKLPDLAVKTIQQAKLIQKQDKNLTFDECVSSVLNDFLRSGRFAIGFPAFLFKIFLNELSIRKDSRSIWIIIKRI